MMTTMEVPSVGECANIETNSFEFIIEFAECLDLPTGASL